MIKILATLLLFAAIAASVIAVKNRRSGGRPYAMTKPLPLILLLLMTGLLALGGMPLTAFRLWIIAGLALGLTGDILLLYGERGFLPGLVSFLLGHLAYIFAFSTRMGRLPLPLIILLTMASFTYLILLVRKMKKKMPMGIAVSIYVAVILSMLLAAIAHDLGRTGFPTLYTLGAALFVLSDSCLGWETFAGRVKGAPILILGTYFAAQILLALQSMMF